MVVRPKDSALIQLLLLEKVRILPCPQAELGMGASLACGVCAAAEADAWLIALADMPYVSPAPIAIRQHNSTLAHHQGQRGHPVGFKRTFYPKLAANG